MIKFAFIARSGDQTMPLEVSIEYQPGKQTQRARRVAVGELLAKLESESAQVDASGAEQVKVQTEQGTWIIAESYSSGAGRGRI